MQTEEEIRTEVEFYKSMSDKYRSKAEVKGVMEGVDLDAVCAIFYQGCHTAVAVHLINLVGLESSGVRVD